VWCSGCCRRSRPPSCNRLTPCATSDGGAQLAIKAVSRGRDGRGTIPTG
jgi:hypothetical protein